MSSGKLTVEAVSTSGAPKAIGPYSQAIRCGSFLYCSGQIALDPVSGQLVGSEVQAQTEQVLKNLAAVLASQGAGLRNILKTTVFLKNFNDFPKFNETYEKAFVAPFPARATVEVSRLPKDALVEIEAVAYLS